MNRATQSALTVIHHEAGEASWGLQGSGLREAKVLAEEKHTSSSTRSRSVRSGGRAGTGGRDDLGPRIDAAPDTRNAGRSGALDEAAQADEQLSSGRSVVARRARHGRGPSSSARPEATRNDTFDRVFDDPILGVQPGWPLLGGEGVGWREVDRVSVRPTIWHNDIVRVPAG